MRHAIVPTIHSYDSPRARHSDPVQSQMSADRSQRTIKLSSTAVLRLVHMEGELAGSEINRLYGMRCERNGWPFVAGDSPRKRAGELCADGFLVAVDLVKGVRLQERVFSLTDQGKREIGVLA